MSRYNKDIYEGKIHGKWLKRSEVIWKTVGPAL